MSEIATTIQKLECNIFYSEDYRDGYGVAIGVAYIDPKHREDPDHPVEFFMGVFENGDTVFRSACDVESTVFEGNDGCYDKEMPAAVNQSDSDTEAPDFVISSIIIDRILREIAKYPDFKNDVPTKFHHALGLVPFTCDTKPRLPRP